jgi:NADPH:quinone reductase-like Zn-dependent oxidoreductase
MHMQRRFSAKSQMHRNLRAVDVVDGLAAGRFKPVIARTLPLAEIVEAHRYLESNQQIGTIVVTA